MIYVILMLLGLCFGSFANALVWRINEQEGLKSKKVKVKARNLSITKGRSMCPNCRHTLAWYDLIPIISWLALVGKCRYCHKKISWQYPMVEVATSLLFIGSYLVWPLGWTAGGSLLFGFWLLFLVGFVALAVYDVRWMLLPDRIIRPLQLLAILYAGVHVVIFRDGWQAILDVILGVLCSAGVFYLLYQLSQGKWIGGGDIKLAVVLGLVLGGPIEALLMIFIASALGSFIGIPLLLAKKTKLQSKLPFGPLLIAATIIVYLFGADLIAWYSHTFLLI